MQITLQRDIVNNEDNRIWCIFVMWMWGMQMRFTIDVYLKENLVGIS